MKGKSLIRISTGAPVESPFDEFEAVLNYFQLEKLIFKFPPPNVRQQPSILQIHFLEFEFPLQIRSRIKME